MITASTDAGTITFEPTGNIKQVLDAATPVDRETLEQHIRNVLAAASREVDFDTQERINDILNPEADDEVGMGW